MNVNLPPGLEDIVQTKVYTGQYNSVSDVGCDAIRLMDERDQFTDLQKDRILRKIDQGLASLSKGKGTDGEAFMAQMLAETDAEIRVDIH